MSEGSVQRLWRVCAATRVEVRLLREQSPQDVGRGEIGRVVERKDACQGCGVSHSSVRVLCIIDFIVCFIHPDFFTRPADCTARFDVAASTYPEL